MKRFGKYIVAIFFAATLLVSATGCGGGGNDAPLGAPTEMPDNVQIFLYNPHFYGSWTGTPFYFAVNYYAMYHPSQELGFVLPRRTFYGSNFGATFFRNENNQMVAAASRPFIDWSGWVSFGGSHFGWFYSEAMGVDDPPLVLGTINVEFGRFEQFIWVGSTHVFSGPSNLQGHSFHRGREYRVQLRLSNESAVLVPFTFTSRDVTTLNRN
ncbi:MAG: hypothetical protein FWC64_01015 [Treponema sp.]|nr:hypothetical protein [Treponema sp.]